jgi:hypothetical protein
VVSVAGASLVLIVADTGQAGAALYELPANTSLALVAGRGGVQRQAPSGDHLDWQVSLSSTLELNGSD